MDLLCIQQNSMSMTRTDKNVWKQNTHNVNEIIKLYNSF